MRRHFLAALLLCSMLVACGQPPAADTAAQPTEHPTALVAPAATQGPDTETNSTPDSTRTLSTQGVATLAAAPLPETTATSQTTQSTEATQQVESTSAPLTALSTTNKIIIDTPRANTQIVSPVTISGSTNFWPFEATLGGVIKDGEGNALVQFPVTVHSPDIGQGGPWSEQIDFVAPSSMQDGTIEIYDTSAKDGSITSITSVKVRLGPTTPGASLVLEAPAAGSTVALPLHVAFSGARGDEKLTLRLTLADGTNLTQQVQADLGYVTTTIPGTGAPGAATLHILRADGTVAAQQKLEVATTQRTTTIKVAWAKQDGSDIVMRNRRIASTQQVGTAALNELLWGPDPGTNDVTSALPAPAEVIHAPNRTPTWGGRVRLLKLTITDGVALANFSDELRAYGGGSTRVTMIRKQIEGTLRQFPSVKQVVIAIEGQTDGVLEP